MKPAFGTINRQTWINHMQNPNRTAMSCFDFRRHPGSPPNFAVNFSNSSQRL
jgi:hypothetical protein